MTSPAVHATDDPAVLLVHGFWHGSWCWSEVAARLTGAGRTVVAVDMAGHGLRARWPDTASARPFDGAAYAAEVSPVADVDLSAAADLLAAQISDLAGGPRPRPVVVVAHSFGGAVLTRAAQQVPHLIAHLVYVSAVMPASGVPGLAYLQSPEQDGDAIPALLCADPAAVGALRLDVRAGGAYRARLIDAFYSDVDPDTAAAATALLTPDAPAAIAAGTTELTADGWGSLRRTYVHCSQDKVIRPALQRRFVREADSAHPQNPTRVVELPSNHSPFLSHPDEFATVIAQAR
jgi:pimeloyl-ACP methyl ester carboxylesterase